MRNVLCRHIAGALAVCALLACGERSVAPPVSVPAAAHRIVPMAPNLVETVFALGMGDRVIAIPDFTVHPEEALALPKVGGTFNANLELMRRLQPDLVIIQGDHERVARLCNSQGIPLLQVRMDSLLTIRSGIEAIGDAVGREEAARALSDSLERDMAAIAERYASRSRPVALVMGRTPGSLRGMSTFGQGSFVTELAAAVGGQNVLVDAAGGYPPVSIEALVARAPEVIVEIRAGETLTPERVRQLKRDWEPLRTVPAVREGRIRFITDPGVLIPGPRVAAMAQYLASAIHEESSHDR